MTSDSNATDSKNAISQHIADSENLEPQKREQRKIINGQFLKNCEKKKLQSYEIFDKVFIPKKKTITDPGQLYSQEIDRTLLTNNDNPGLKSTFDITLKPLNDINSRGDIDPEVLSTMRSRASSSKKRVRVTTKKSSRSKSKAKGRSISKRSKGANSSPRGDISNIQEEGKFVSKVKASNPLDDTASRSVSKSKKKKKVVKKKKKTLKKKTKRKSTRSKSKRSKSRSRSPSKSKSRSPSRSKSKSKRGSKLKSKSKSKSKKRTSKSRSKSKKGKKSRSASKASLKRLVTKSSSIADMGQNEENSPGGQPADVVPAELQVHSRDYNSWREESPHKQPPAPRPNYDKIFQEEFREIDDGILAGIPPEITGSKRDKLFLERKAFAESLKEELRLPGYRSVMRRVAAFRDYKPVDTHSSVYTREEHSSMRRLDKANFRFQQIEETEEKADRRKAGESVMDYYCNKEVSWYGTISKFGKKEEFLIEHLVFLGRDILGYMTQGDSLITLKGKFLEPEIELSDTNTTFEENSRSLPFKLTGLNTSTQNKYEIKGFFDKFQIKASLRDIPQKMVTRVISLSLKSRTCTVFFEPGKRLLQGRVKFSDNHIIVLFLDQGKVNIISGILNKNGIYNCHFITGARDCEMHVITETDKPIKVVSKPEIFCFAEEKGTFGIILEIVTDPSLLKQNLFKRQGTVPCLNNILRKPTNIYE